MSGKYSQKLFDYAKQFATDALKTTSKRAIHKAAEAAGELIWAVIKLLIELRKSQKLHKEIIQKQFINDHDKEIPKERYISSEERQKIIEDLRFV